ncbi:citrate lyase subunit beta / citryl-CoA lyase [Lentibacillus halodurans]|uniref:Citrate lyase subunit beta / citryl-CoA lyase n=1 Tax=Lentibacillus halodurans TaxID=237679 RepID=A0A1I0XNR5_9BACI|nr:CoA ester lyase [Lentibacillus halodurans]SFB02544.1 citrate lyase subunit beta / citryl-CoA lyase [Lentibacillus halodurans]
MNNRRSYLFVPAKKRSMISKAVGSDADSIILDLEDALAYSEKDSGRELVKESLKAFTDEKSIYVRINDISTSYWRKDLVASVEYGANGVIIPKSESEEDVRWVCEEAYNILKKMELNEKEIDFNVIPLLETAKGIQFAYEIANSHPFVSNLAFGSIDFSLDIGCELTASGHELLYARSRIVIASRSAEISKPIDTVYFDLDNLEGLGDEAILAKRIGFGGKLIIHPKQIEHIHKVFTPQEEALREAEQIVEEFEKAELQGLASISVNGKLVDYPVYKKAKEMVDLN